MSEIHNTEYYSEMQAPISIEAFNRLNRELQQMKRFLEWEDDLFANPELSGNRKIQLRALRRQYNHAQHQDDQGRRRINLTTIAERTGTSLDTASRTLKVLEKTGVIDSHDLVPEVTEDDQLTTRHYIHMNEEVLKRPRNIALPEGEKRKQGGNRYQCQKCGRDEGLKIRKRITLICPCGHESLIEETETTQDAIDEETGRSNLLLGDSADTVDAKQVEQVEATCFLPGEVVEGTVEPPKENFLPGDDATCGTLYRHIPPPNVAHSIVPSPDRNTIYRAAELLLAVAGPEEIHIFMKRKGDKKYLDEKGRVTHEDLQDHLRGLETYGAFCRYPDGTTRALIWDADGSETWPILELAASQLVDHGYVVLLEKSPAGRGGHLITIFDDLVDVACARAHMLSIAPELETIREYWPKPGGNKVRLPGGKYLYGMNKWCEIVSVSDGKISTNGESAATLLLTHQTPAAIVPPLPTIPTPPAGPVDDQSQNDQARTIQTPPLSTIPPACNSVSSTSQESCWFSWRDKPGYLPRRYNERHSLDDLIDFNRGGYALASWRGERTASVARMKDGLTWHDFGNADEDKKHGDAFELHVALENRSKREVLAELAREAIAEARAALESSARDGQPLPGWVEEIVTPAGRAHYAEIAGGGYMPIPIVPTEPVQPLHAQNGQDWQTHLQTFHIGQWVKGGNIVAGQVMHVDTSGMDIDVMGKIEHFTELEVLKIQGVK